jgi:hypothetical protein
VREEPAAHDRTPYTTRPQRPSPLPNHPSGRTPTPLPSALPQHTTSATVAAAREAGISTPTLPVPREECSPGFVRNRIP